MPARICLVLGLGALLCSGCGGNSKGTGDEAGAAAQSSQGGTGTTGGGDTSGAEGGTASTTTPATSDSSSGGGPATSGGGQAGTAGAASSSGGDAATSAAQGGSGGSTSTAAGGSGGGRNCAEDCEQAGLLCCYGQCVNPANDINNCGACGVVCAGPSPFCSGTCQEPFCDAATQCAAGDTCCGNECCGEGELCCTVNIGPSVTSCVTPENGTCPVGCPLCVCASPDTPVATPDGERAIRDLQVGDLVYSVHDSAIRVVAVRQVNVVPAPNHRIVRLELSSGARLEISAPHPTADGRLFGDLDVGDSLGGARVVRREIVDYGHAYTYDILPDSDTGYYFAAGVMLGSTLHGPQNSLPASASGGEQKLPDCIKVKAEARYGAMGYDHWVAVTNQCQVTARCQVSSNVNPKPQAVSVKPGRTEEVLTFRGSPARTFEPRVHCTLQNQ